MLIKSFFLGVFSCVPAVLLTWLGESIGLSNQSDNIIFSAFSCIAGIGFTEEFSKFIFVRYYTFRKPDFNEPFDGITYCVMVAIGFATFENFLYVLNSFSENGYSGGFSTAFIRAIFSVPGHAMFGVIMGFYLGIEKHNKKINLGFYGLVLAAVAHGMFDFCLFNAGKYPMLILFFLLLFGFIVKLSLKAIKIHQEDSPFKNGNISGSHN